MNKPRPIEIDADAVRLSEVVFDFSTYWASAYHDEGRAYPGDSREAAALALEWALEFEHLETARDLGFIEQQQGVTIPPAEYEEHPDRRAAWLEGYHSGAQGKGPPRDAGTYYERSEAFFRAKLDAAEPGFADPNRKAGL